MTENSVPGDNRDMEAIITTEWFTRYGTVFTGRVHDVDLNKGTAKHTYQAKCSRCGGAGGSDKWKFTGWTCFECGGNGQGSIRTEKLYSADRLAKLDAAQAKRDAARQVKAQAAAEAKAQAAREAYQAFYLANREVVDTLGSYAEAGGEDGFLLDMWRKLEEWGHLTPAQLEAAQKSLDRMKAQAAAKAASQFVGEIGKRLVFTLTCEKIIVMEFESQWGQWDRNTGRQMSRSYLHLCRDEQGNRVVYKGAHRLVDEKETFRVKATVEAHDDYKGEAQTKIARPKVLGVRDQEDGKFYIWDSKVSGLVEVK